MRIAVISDIHSDSERLEQVLTAIDAAPLPVDEIWSLGDALGAPRTKSPNPRATLELVQARMTVLLAGNHERSLLGDWAWAGGEPVAWLEDELEKISAKLSDQERAQIGTWPAAGSRHGIELYHGASFDPVGGFLRAEDAPEHFENQSGRISIVGHTHRARLLAELDAGGNEYLAVDPTFSIPLNLSAFPSRSKLALNPGSISFKQYNREDETRSSWLLLAGETDDWREATWFPVE